MKISKPLYMAGKKVDCWKCCERMSVIALIAPKTDDPELEGEVCILSSIESMPENLLKYIQSRVPTFRKKLSKTVGDSYLANTCPKCKSLSGDFFLHSEPGGAFFPMDEDEAKELYIVELPLTDTVEIESGYSVGSGEVILDNAKKIA